MTENYFIVEQGRFHISDKNVFIVRGWCPEDNLEDNQVKVFIDNSELETKVDKYEGLAVRQRYMGYNENIIQEYYIYIKLPKNLTDYKKLNIYTVNGAEKHLSFSFPIKKLVKTQTELECYIEKIEYIEKKYIVKGWVASCNSVHINAYIKGNRMSGTITMFQRKDVKDVFKEAEINIESGFKIELPSEKNQKITLVINDESSESRYTINGKRGIQEKININFSIFHKGIEYLKKYGIRRFVQKIREKLGARNNQEKYSKWLSKHLRSKEELEYQRKEEFDYSPKFSIVIPLYKTPISYLSDLINSVINQTYSNWELCLSDGSGKGSKLKNVLSEYSRKDNRIKYISSDIPLGISDNTNMALSIATGEYIVLADHDDLLTLDALYECVKAVNKDKEIEVLYTDEDKVSMDGKTFFSPHFKSDFNIDLFRSMNYICHLFIANKELVDKVGGFSKVYDGAQDYDFILRCTEMAKTIHHIPRILYHWRSHMDSTAENPESKLYAYEAGKKAIEDHYKRMGIAAEVSHGPFYGIYKTKYILNVEPLISIIIPNKDHIDDLEKCITSVEDKSIFRNYEIIIVENNSTEDSTFEYYKQLEVENAKVKVVYYKGDFNYSLINNFGSKYANGEFLLLLNNDTEIINEDCLSEMLGYCLREDVGIVGAKLLYEDDTIQHAGVVIGFGDIAGHTFIGASKYDTGYFSRIICAQNYSAVTAACMMTKKSVFNHVGGLTPDLKVAFNDIDYCLKVRELGKLVVYNPYAQLYHYESKSRGLENTPEKVERFNREIAIFRERWAEILKNGDPYYNINLSLDKSDFSLKRL